MLINLAMKKQRQPIELIKVELTEGMERYPDVLFEYVPDSVVKWGEEAPGRFLFTCENGLAMRLEVVNEAVLRFRYAPTGVFERDFSYVLEPAHPATGATFAEAPEHYTLSTASLICEVSKTDLRTRISDRQSGQILCEDAESFYAASTQMKGLIELRISKKAPAATRYFGLGDKTCPLNLRGQKLQNWNTDAFAFDKKADPLYRSIPFYYALNAGAAYGIFLHNPSRSHFDFDHKHTGLTRFWAECGEMDYLFIHGPKLDEVAVRYTQLTGLPELPPLWALGFHQSRWGYYPESRVFELVEDFRRHQIPCDAVYLDIDYMHGYRCFTWDKSHFPNPTALIADLKQQGFQTVVMIDPGIRVDPDYEVYRSGLAQGFFCRRSSGELMTGPVWPPSCVFPDYTLPAARSWWGEWYRELYNEQGVSGFWNDMNEPAVFKVNNMTFPDAVQHHYDGDPCDHRKAHNIYGLQMSRATYEGLKMLQPHKRPYLLTRATFSGGQRYAAVWTGDNVASWEHLRLANLQCQRLSISGFSMCGTDVGGFVDQPDGELFVRWLQLGIFHGVFRIHSMGNNASGNASVDENVVQEAAAADRMDQEPWSFGEPYTAQARQAIELRYQLLPYLYTAFRQCAINGIPVIRSLVFYDQEDPKTWDREGEFVFGSHLLAAPVLRKGAKFQRVYLPKGQWLAYHSGAMLEGGRLHRVALTPENFPLFVQAGAVIPNHPVRQHTGEAVAEATLRVYYGEGAESAWYEDAGEGYDYANGAYCLRRFRTEKTADGFCLSQMLEGNYKAGYERIRLLFLGLPDGIKKIVADGRETAFELKTDGVEVFLPGAEFGSVKLFGVV